MSRPRTRSQWGDYYKNLHENIKGPRSKRTRNAVEESLSRDDEVGCSRGKKPSDVFVDSVNVSSSGEEGCSSDGEAMVSRLHKAERAKERVRETKIRDEGYDQVLNYSKNSTRINDAEQERYEVGKTCPDPSVFSKEYDEKSKSTMNEFKIEGVVRKGQKITKEETKQSKQENFRARTLGLIKFLAESKNPVKENKDHHTDEESFSPLPLKFGFEDELPPLPHVKSEREKEMDSLFCDLQLGLLQTQMDCTNSSVVNDEVCSETEIDQSPAACCARGDHHHILDEQIGIICKYCLTTILDIKYVLPQFYTPSSGRYDYKKDPDKHSIGPIQFPNSCTSENASCTQGNTVWDLIPGVQKELYPHQRQGFEFMWNNIAGSILTEKMKYPLPEGKGCIISHAPGTGKTRLTIVFLQSFLKLYPMSHPVIVAPRGMLLTWESEFVKWNVNIPFHNLNKKELSQNESSFAAEICENGPMSVECMRLVKLASWLSGGSILGISYHLFKNLVLENKESGAGIKNQIKKLLLECPGLLVLDEGHTPRNDNSKIWKALSKVETHRRIILSGTPFQNNLTELYTTLGLVNPKLVNMESSNKKRWMNMTDSIIGTDENVGLKELRAMLDTFVHVHKGTILEESLPGLRDTLVFLHPTESQKILLEETTQTRSIFHRIQQVSLISVHPSLTKERKLEEIESVDEGVKARFVMKLIRLADAVGERVLVFSQFLSPLEFIKKQIKARFSWKEGRELLYMDGQMDERNRQDSILCFNDGRSEARVLLASERACSEGISLVGASRVVLLDTVWNPSVEKQAVSRAYRLGQKKVVYVYRLFTSGTEVRQYSRQIQKERISQLLFSTSTPAVDGQSFRREEESVEAAAAASDDKILEAMRGLEGFGHIFEKIIRQPKESDLVEIFGLMDQN